MKKNLFLIAILALISTSISAQSPADKASAATVQGNRMEATVICLDAVEAPTQYNAFAKQFITAPSFPVKKATTSRINFRKEINTWFVTNPKLVAKVLVERKKAHDQLYGPRPY